MPRVKNLKACTGCLRCELACSYHHTGEFSRSHSSIRVNKPLLDHDLPAQVNVLTAGQGVRPPCDLCSGQQIPFCIRFCPESVLTDESEHP